MALSKGFSFLAISVALTLSGSPVMAKGGGGPSQVKTSGNSGSQGGNSATQGGNAAGGSIAHRPATGCGHATHGACAFPSQGATSGNDPRGPNRGPGNPTLHPK
jgi:hypothetical protein